jgi:hypothetical protein
LVLFICLCIGCQQCHRNKRFSHEYLILQSEIIVNISLFSQAHTISLVAQPFTFWCLDIIKQLCTSYSCVGQCPPECGVLEVSAQLRWSQGAVSYLQNSPTLKVLPSIIKSMQFLFFYFCYDTWRVLAWYQGKKNRMLGISENAFHFLKCPHKILCSVRVPPNTLRKNVGGFCMCS